MPAPVVFTGLSLSQEEARTLLAAEVRPPVKRGDLDQLSDGAAPRSSMESSVEIPPFRLMRSAVLCVEA